MSDKVAEISQKTEKDAPTKTPTIEDMKEAGERMQQRGLGSILGKFFPPGDPRVEVPEGPPFVDSKITGSVGTNKDE
ncbi:MAG: hypothetical protein AAB656_03295 [Patescibacteria group bacterium]